MPEEIKELNTPGVEMVGFVEDPSSYFLKARLFVSPLRYGAGVKGKLGQSMQYGLPIVTTPIGSEGMHLKNNVNALISDTANSFAKDVVRLYTDKPTWELVSSNSKKVVEQYFSQAAATKVIKKII